MPYWFRIAFPQAITLSGIFCGMLAILWAPMRPYWACTAIIVAALCDTVDGRIARVLKTQSTFGAQLDSLADIVSFGLAPAYLVYYWVFAPQEFVVFDLSWLFLFFFVFFGLISIEALLLFLAIISSLNCKLRFCLEPCSMSVLTWTKLDNVVQKAGKSGKGAGQSGNPGKFRIGKLR